MMGFDVVAVFFAASVALALAPGPDNIFVLTQSALHGRGAGLFVTLGLCSGLLVHTAAVSLGVAALFAASSVAFTSLKMLGAAYLLYLAWRAFRGRPGGTAGEAAPTAGPSRLYARGVIMNVTNPKVAIFFLAFLPQFADPTRGSLTAQLLALGAVFMAATLLVFGSIACAAGSLGAWLRRSARARVVMERVAGTVFVALALRLAAAER
jgi:threonine/homoserine/homoserine lactone efflux protein